MPSLLDLPFELRQRVLAFALQEDGTVELQHPLWASEQVYFQPLFQVCQLLRDEALQAFYENNHFLWIVDVAVQRSDPARYASMMIGEGETFSQDCYSRGQTPLIPTLPWEYPHLKKHLRRLHVNVYLPSNFVGDATASQDWLKGMPERLHGLVRAVDSGRRLSALTVLITANTKRFNTRISLEGEQLKVLNILGGMQIKGRVNVQTRYDFKAVRASIDGLELEKKMKAL